MNWIDNLKVGDKVIVQDILGCKQVKTVKYITSEQAQKIIKILEDKQ